MYIVSEHFSKVISSTIVCVVLQALAILSSMPPSVSNHLLKAKALLRAHKYTDVTELLSSVLENESLPDFEHSECLLLLGFALLCDGEPAKAIATLDRVDENGMPWNQREMLFFHRGLAKLRMGQSREGLTDISRTLLVNPRSYQVQLL